MTELLNRDTGDLMETMTRAEAEDFIRFMRAAQTQIPRRVVDAYHRRAWVPLGYASWEVMIAAEGLAIRLPRDERQQMSMFYSAEGLSTRAIAPVLGVDQKTVHNDRRAGEEFSSPDTPQTPAPESEGEADEGAGQTPQVEDAPAHVGAVPSSEARPETAPAPRPAVTGLDGKTYTPPAPKAAPKPVLDGNDAEYANARQASERLARAVAKLLEFEHPNMRAGMRRYWAMASNEVPPAQRADVTPEQMRAAAQGLLTLADEWNRS